MSAVEPERWSRDDVNPTPYDRDLAEGDRPLFEASDLLTMVYSWHLPGGTDAKDGRYLISVHGAGSRSLAVHDGLWTRATFPVCMFTCYDAPSGGIDGMGVGHILRHLQYTIDRTLTRLDDELDTLGHTKVIGYGGEDAQVESNVVAPGMTYVPMPLDAPVGQPPFQIVPGNPQSMQALQWFEKMTSWAYRLVGINEMAAQGMTARGANASALSMYEEDDRQMDRFADVESRWDLFLTRCAEETINALNDEAKRNEAFRVSFLGADRGGSEKWLTLSPPTADQHLSIELVGAAGRRKSGRIARIMELVDRGGVHPEDGMAEASQSADMRRLMERTHAARRLVEWQLAGLSLSRSDPASYDIYWPSKATTPPELALRMGLSLLQIATRRRASAATLDRLQNYLDIAQSLLPAPAPPAAPPPDAMPQGAPGEPPAMPMPPLSAA